MRTYLFPFSLLSLWISGTQCLAAVLKEEPAITERGPHHRVWSRQEVRALPDGRVATNVSSFVELGSGMHRWDAQAGQYVDANDQIEIAPDGSGAFGRNGSYEVHFSPNANTAGAITLITPDGKTLKSHALSLAWFDSATGQSEQIALIRDSIGELHAPNVVIYPDAFDGEPGFRADLKYTYRLDGFSQDIVILTKPPELPPGYAPDTTRLEVWTEFIEAPSATLTQRGRAGMTDDTLNFGAMQTGSGKAFSLGEDTTPKRSAPVAKRWLTTREGRTFLVEAVRYQFVESELAKLPVPQGQAGLKQRNPNAQLAAKGVGERPFPSAPKPRSLKQGETIRRAAIAPSPREGERAALSPGAGGGPGKPQLSSLHSPQRGFLIDYELKASLTNLTLQCDTTYVVSNAVTFYGTITFEGGCVIKFAPTNVAKLTFDSSSVVVWKTSPYRPAILTAVDDHTVGTTIGAGTLSGRYGGGYLNFGGSLGDPKHLRISYAATGISSASYYPVIRHAQFVHCSNSIACDLWPTAMVTMENCLFYDVSAVFKGNSQLFGTHLTVHQCGKFSDGAVTNAATLLNCLFIRQTNWGSVNKTLTTCFEGSDDSVFQTLGAAAHYLPADSPHRDAGTTAGVSSTLLADLKKRTTFPPLVLSGLLTNDLTLIPQAQRDINALDLGYHYDPLDFVCNGLSLNGKRVTATTGTALGVWSTNNTIAIVISEGSRLVSTGSPTNLNRLVRYNAVQEQANNSWTGFGEALYPMSNSGSGTPLVHFRFNEWVVPGRNTLPHYYNSLLEVDFSIADSEVHGGYLTSWLPSFSITNCLLNRTTLELWDQLGEYELLVKIRNSTFRGGNFYFEHFAADTWTIRDNLFDGTTNAISGDVTANWNAYTTNLTRLTPFGANDVLLATNAIGYQTSTLGFFYLPDTGPGTNLFNRGSTNANLLGLFHYTTTTNQVKETTTTNDIGFHYLAVGSNGLPADGDNDGLPDYIEDANGNGSLDHGETKTNDAADWGLRVFITRPKSGSTLP